MAKYKKPIFKIRNTFSGKYLTVNDTGGALKHLADSGESDQHWKWNHGLESVAFPGFNVKISDDGSVSIAASDSLEISQTLILRNGRIENKVMNLTLGINQNTIQSYQDQPKNSWIAQYVGNDMNEIPFERLTPEKKPKHGSWPFDCEHILTCTAASHQTCGCWEYSSNKRAISYFIGPGSKLASQLDFQSCEELKLHGVDISGHFMIKGIKTYCHFWSTKSFR